MFSDRIIASIYLRRLGLVTLSVTIARGFLDGDCETDRVLLSLEPGVTPDRRVLVGDGRRSGQKSGKKLNNPQIGMKERTHSVSFIDISRGN